MIADYNAIIFSIFGAAGPAPILLYHKNRPFGGFLRLNFLIVSGKPIGCAYGVRQYYTTPNAFCQ